MFLARVRRSIFDVARTPPARGWPADLPADDYKNFQPEDPRPSTRPPHRTRPSSGTPGDPPPTLRGDRPRYPTNRIRRAPSRRGDIRGRHPIGPCRSVISRVCIVCVYIYIYNIYIGNRVVTHFFGSHIVRDGNEHKLAATISEQARIARTQGGRGSRDGRGI